MPMNYPGDVTAAIQRDIDNNRPMGPNYLGELMWPTSATYDPEVKRTRVEFTLVAPPAEVVD